MRHLILAALLALVPLSLTAQEGPIRVGVVDYPPYAIAGGEGAFMGMGVDVWRLVAERMGRNYEFVEADADALASGDVDVLLPVVASPDAEERFDLTPPFHTATMGVAAPRQSRVWAVLDGFLSWQFLRIVAGLSVVLLAVGALIWLVERRRNPEQFSRGVVKGLGDGFWWAGVTLTTIGYGDKAPATVAGRAVAMVWMLVGLAVSAALTAAIVTLAQPDPTVTLPDRFADRTVAVEGGSATERYLSSADVTLEPVGSLADALAAVAEDRADLAAAPAPALKYAVDTQGGADFAVKTTRLDPLQVGMATATGAELSETIARTLLQVISSEAGWDVIQRYDQADD